MAQLRPCNAAKTRNTSFQHFSNAQRSMSYGLEAEIWHACFRIPTLARMMTTSKESPYAECIENVG
jgi:hypothetical protein